MRFTPQLRALDFIVSRPIAHRGLHDKAKGVIENTASAFDAAIAGNYAIECDLQITKEGEAVVFHDEGLERLTEGKGKVRHLTAAEMKAQTIRGSSDRVQTLQELLEQVDGRVPLVIELKSHWNGDDTLAARALDVLETYEGSYCIMSFDPDIIEAVRVMSPDTIRGIVADRAADGFYNSLPLERRLELRSLSHLKRTEPDFISFFFGELPWAPLTAYRQAGHPVISWTIRSPEQACKARRYSDQITFERFIA
jgi:glycerophosphoryl diester phosphodiesterase